MVCESLVTRSLLVGKLLLIAECLVVPPTQFLDATLLLSKKFSCVPVALLGTASVYRGEDRLPLGLVASDLRSFESVIGRLSVEAHLPIVAEGVPSRPELTVTETIDLQKALAASPEASLAAILAQIAAAYDYDVEKSGGGYLLRKRYTDPTDLPCVTLEEIVRSLRSLLALAEVYAPATLESRPRAETSGFRFYDSLTLAQQAAAHGGQGLDLKLSDLDPIQRQLALATARRVVLDSQTDALRRTLNHLSNLNGNNVNFLWTTRADQIYVPTRGRGSGAAPVDNRPALHASPVFEYVMPSGSPDFIYQYPLNRGVKINLDGGGVRVGSPLLEQIAPNPSVALHTIPADKSHPTVTVASASQASAATVRDDYDPTVPTSQDRLLASGMMSNKLASTWTLEALAASLSSANSRNNSAKLNIKVDPVLNGKPVTIFGREFISGGQLIRLAARVYGLQISTSDNKTIYVTTPKAHAVQSVADLQSEIRRMLLPSLLRADESQIDRIEALTPELTELSAQYTSAQRQKFHDKLAMQKRERTALVAPDSWYFPADRRLILLATAAVPTPSSPPISVASLGPEPSRLIALMSLTDGGMAAMRNMLGFEPPRCFTDPSTLRINIKCREQRLMQLIPIEVKSDGEAGDEHIEGQTLFGRHLLNTPSVH